MEKEEIKNPRYIVKIRRTNRKSKEEIRRIVKEIKKKYNL